MAIDFTLTAQQQELQRASRKFAKEVLGEARRAELLATESWIEQRDALLQLDAAALIADIALQRALGRGYESPQKLANSHSIAAKTTP